jgi:hypothetical protein
MTSRKLEILRHGRWSSGQSKGHVWIVRQGWDYYHEDFYDEGPDLNDQGWAYYALYGSEPEIGQHTSRSQTCFSEAEAVQRAESAFDSIAWDSDDNLSA